MDKYFKSPLVDEDKDIEEREEQMKDNHVTNQEVKDRPIRNDVDVKRFSEEQRYPARECLMFGELWKNHILPNMIPNRPLWHLLTIF